MSLMSLFIAPPTDHAKIWREEARKCIKHARRIIAFVRTDPSKAEAHFWLAMRARASAHSAWSIAGREVRLSKRS